MVTFGSGLSESVLTFVTPSPAQPRDPNPTPWRSGCLETKGQLAMSIADTVSGEELAFLEEARLMNSKMYF